jgi:hypothetical protein
MINVLYAKPLDSIIGSNIQKARMMFLFCLYLMFRFRVANVFTLMFFINKFM